ncbi:MAG: hypothetical protein QM617_03800 [Comamonas sp.]
MPKRTPRSRLALAAAALFGGLLLGTASHAAPQACDRACLQELAHEVLVSMKNHKPGDLPLARFYRLTENGAPMAPIMSSLWRNVTDFKDPGPGQYVIDVAAGQVFVVAHVYEGPGDAIFFGRLAVVDRKLSELELYVSRSKGESGQLFDPSGLDDLPVAWSRPLAPEARVSRAELDSVARSMLDRRYRQPEGSRQCELVEMGGRVIEDPEALKAIMKDDAPDLSQRQLKGGVSVPCTASDRPEDRQVRVLIDEEAGATVSLGVVPGTVYPSFINPGLESTFVPTDMAAGWKRLPAEIHDPNGTTRQPRGTTYVPVFQALPSSMAVAEMTKYQDGKIVGLQRYLHMQPTGAGSPWTAPATPASR